MRYCIVILTILALFLFGCTETPPKPQQLMVKPASPPDGSSIPSLTPVLLWGGGSNITNYRLLVAADANFQKLIIDASNLAEPNYTIPSGKLNNSAIYYWKVIATQGSNISDWSIPWSFQTPAGESAAKRGSIRITATLDGSIWSGTVNYSIRGPFSDTDNSLPWNFDDLTAGTYTITYNYGGPAGATLASITPAPTQDVIPGGITSFTLNFHKKSASSITINSTLNGSPWSGAINYSLTGPYNDAESIVPQTLGNLPTGTYTLGYSSGSPAGAILTGITPATVQTLSEGSNIIYTLNFTTQSVSNLSVTAFFNGSPWSGPVRYSLSGQINTTRTEVPYTINNAPAGTYNITYESGGPAGAVLGSIIPATTVTLSSGRSGSFTLNFNTQQQTGNVVVNANLNGAPWSGVANYQIIGPFQTVDNVVPRTYANLPAGGYSIVYTGGGPAGASLTSITPAPSQTLAGNRTIIFNLNFVAQVSTGNINVSATLDGKPWQTALGSGSISYSLSGTKNDAGSSIPATFNNMPSGPYTLNYNGGGPIGATLTNISPSPAQNLSPGGTISYTLNFTGQPKGTIMVNATLNGQSWSGEVGYVVTGSYVESGSSLPWSFSNAPAGSYSVQYSAGGPPNSTFEGISPSTQILPAGGRITFTIMFKFRGITPTPTPVPVPGPIPGPIGGDSPLTK